MALLAKAVVIGLCMAAVIYAALRVTIRKRRREAILSALVCDLTLRIEDGESGLSVRGLVDVCQVEQSPRALVEAGIWGLFVAHKSVLSATNNERVRAAILPAVHESFLAEIAPIASQAALSEDGIVALVARRFATYDSLMDTSLPRWQDHLSEQIYENITDILDTAQNRAHNQRRRGSGTCRLDTRLLACRTENTNLSVSALRRKPA